MEGKSIFVILSLTLIGCTTFSRLTEKRGPQQEKATFKLQELNQARESLFQAKEVQAQKYAPKNFKAAQDALNQAKSMLASGRTSISKIRLQAERAQMLARKSLEIGELSKLFERHGYSYEEIVMWYHSKLNKFAIAIGEDLSYSHQDNERIDTLARQMAELKDSMFENLDVTKMREERIDRLQMRFSSILKKDEAKRLRSTELRERFKAVQSMFHDDEAKIYRKDERVIIIAHGLDFLAGEAQIDSSNYPLVTKLVGAIHHFPQAKKVIISGHTDMGGDQSMNLDLSRKRAENLKKLMERLGEFEKGRLVSAGYGEKMPSMEAEGPQAQKSNRRIEIEIIEP